MKHRSPLFMLFLIATLTLLFLPGSQADTWNKKTEVTFNQPVELPTGVILQPGKYVMKLADSLSNRHIVQVFNEREDHVYATILAIPNWRMQPTGDTVITFHEMPAGQAKSLRAWFYPGDNFGQEFAYPANRATQIASVTHQEVAKLTTEDESTLAKQAEPAPMPEEKTEIAESKPAEVENAVQPAEPASPEPQAPAAQSTPRTPEPAAAEQLPATASQVPLMGLIGMISVAAAFGIRAVRKRIG